MIRWLLIYLFVCNNYIKQKHSVKIQKLHQLSQSGSSMQNGGVENWEGGACICIFIHCIYDIYKIECNKNHLRWVPFRMYSCFIPSIPETNSGSDQDKLLTEDEWINECCVLGQKRILYPYEAAVKRDECLLYYYYASWLWNGYVIISSALII